jgi:hypothetical protein
VATGEQNGNACEPNVVTEAEVNSSSIQQNNGQQEMKQ